MEKTEATMKPPETWIAAAEEILTTGHHTLDPLERATLMLRLAEAKIAMEHLRLERERAHRDRRFQAR